jgi:UDP-N-acetylmuramate-alanine ligase
VAEREPGDVVLIMSNGGFEGIHRRLVTALQQAGPAAHVG